MDQIENLTIKEIFILAVKNQQEGKTDIALKFYNQVIKIDPNYSQAHNNLGIIFKTLGENQKAMDYLKKSNQD